MNEATNVYGITFEVTEDYVNMIEVVDDGKTWLLEVL